MMMDAKFPIALLICLCAWMLCFLQWLHGAQMAWYGVVIFGVGVGLIIVLWILSLTSVHASAQKSRKLSVAFRLMGLLAFAFSMTFIMIFMYHWLNEDGHVHGASSGGGEISLGEGVLGRRGQAEVFTAVHIKGYKLPIKAQLSAERLLLTANQKKTLTVILTNRSDQEIEVRVAAKVAPSAVKSRVHYSLMHDEANIVLQPGETRRVSNDLMVGADFPEALQPFVMEHFIFGPDDPSAWLKMQGPIQLIHSDS